MALDAHSCGAQQIVGHNWRLFDQQLCDEPRVQLSAADSVMNLSMACWAKRDHRPRMIDPTI